MKFICQHCGKEENTHWGDKTNNWLFENKRCFTCDHWLQWVNKRDNRCVVSDSNPGADGKVNRVHHYISNEIKGGDHLKGYSGYRFYVHFKDGRNVTTTNLWHQGTIPEHFHHLFEINAEFGPKRDVEYITYEGS